jgi:predicted CoA-binding protein
MTQRTIAVVGVGFAPKKSPEAQAEELKNKEAATVSRVPKTPISREVELPADSTDRNVLAGEIGEAATIAVVGVDFAPKKSK